jgi:hypothetical protein
MKYKTQNTDNQRATSLQHLLMVPATSLQQAAEKSEFCGIRSNSTLRSEKVHYATAYVRFFSFLPGNRNGNHYRKLRLTKLPPSS